MPMWSSLIQTPKFPGNPSQILILSNVSDNQKTQLKINIGCFQKLAGWVISLITEWVIAWELSENFIRKWVILILMILIVEIRWSADWIWKKRKNSKILKKLEIFEFTECYLEDEF